MSKTFTITIGDQAENHVGMQKIGKLANSGFDLDDLHIVQKWFLDNGAINTDIYDLSALAQVPDLDPAFVLVIRNGLDCLLADIKKSAGDFFLEQDALEKDTKAFMYGRVVNKHARHNLCFANDAQAPDYEHGKGRIVSFDDVPLLQHIMKRLPGIIGEKGANLVAEGNYYYDISKCGIGFHGDSERRLVIGVRSGDSLPMHWQWFKNSEPIGERIIVPLNGGDVYLMSAKAVGTDWKNKKNPTLRHATGAKKFVTIK